jgi:type IV secretory pathway VirJ component
MRRRLTALLTAALLGATAVGLAACGSSNGGLISAAQATPLQVDIEAVEKAAEEGDGNCKATEEALLKTDQDYAALPASVNSTLRGKLRLGIENLHKVAREACAQPLGGTTTATTPKTPAPTTTEKTITTPKTTTTNTTPTTPTPPVHEHEEAEHGTGGGTAAPGETESPGVGTPEENAGAGGGGVNGAGGSESK